jgi:hypothetical protein
MKTTSKYFPCLCAGGTDSCGYLLVVEMGGDYEFCWVKNKKIKHAKIGVYLTGKQLQKLKDFLNEKD